MNKLSTIKVILLGLAQDAGVPQIGCDCVNCKTIDSMQGWPVSLALVDENTEQYWIIDVTPKFSQQYNWLKAQYPAYRFSGILLTHAHIGHYTGLMYLGKEAMNTVSMPVYATTSMQQFLSDNAPWSQLVADNNIQFYELESEQNFRLSENLKVKPVAVNHRSEFTDTLAFLIKGPNKNLFYCPDIDSWDGLTLNDYLGENDYALLDGTFFNQDELPGRNLKEIPHPFVNKSVELVKNQPFKTRFIHLNHSNPLWQEGRERKWLYSLDIKLPKFAQSWTI